MRLSKFLMLVMVGLMSLSGICQAAIQGNGPKTTREIQAIERFNSQTRFERGVILKQLNEVNPDYVLLQKAVRHRENPNPSGILPVPNDAEGLALANQIAELDRQQQLADLRTAIVSRQRNLDVTNSQRDFIRRGTNADNTFYSKDTMGPFGS